VIDNRARIALLLFCSLMVGNDWLSAAELRIWVDLRGRFSVEARAESFDGRTVVLKRKDGGLVSLAVDQLSEQDKQYLAKYRQQQSASNNPLRSSAPSYPSYDPLPALDLPAADRHLPNSEPLEFLPTEPLAIPDSRPPKLAADPSPTVVQIEDSLIQIYGVDVYDVCSVPIPVTTRLESGERITSIGMSISRGSSGTISHSKNQLVRFDIDQQQAYVSLNHRESIRLLDHYPDSDRSLALTGFDSRGTGGQIAVATGWGPSGVRLSMLRPLGPPDQDVRIPHPRLRWAKWIDDEHFVAVIDESCGVWNIVSGRQLWRVDDIDFRSTPALSGGCRYLAVPIKNAVALYSTETGKPLGRINVERSIPGVRFSPHSDRLAITTSRRLQCWDLTTAQWCADIQSRALLGNKNPIWIDADLILSGSGVLISLFRGVPLWRYDIAASEIASVGNRMVLFHKQAISELACTKIPHPAAQLAIDWFDTNTPKVAPESWELLGTSKWTDSDWMDENQRISAAGMLRQQR
jgi:hypothetical protein